ncbi:MAG: NAD-dependent epimerase/dehydratase family protein [Acidimicrobiales bacterium]
MDQEATDDQPKEDSGSGDGFWRERSVLVTGATGFLGTHLTAALLDAGAEVTVLTRDAVPRSALVARWWDRVTRVAGEIPDQALLERILGEYDVGTVFHLAAQSQVGVAQRSPVSTYESNVAGTWSLLEASRRSPLVGQVVVASSDKAYGAQPVLPYTEDMPLRAVNPYDVSKACADLISHSFWQTHGVPVTVTRCGNLFGPGDLNWQRIVPGTIRSVLRDEQPVIRSDGTMVRDYLYVGDAVLAYLRLVEAMAADPGLAGEAFNFSVERPLSVLELVGLVQAAAGTRLEPDIRSTAKHEIEQQFLSAAKGRRLLGWAPRFGMEDALSQTVAWYRDHLCEDNKTPHPSG